MKKRLALTLLASITIQCKTGTKSSSDSANASTRETASSPQLLNFAQQVSTASTEFSNGPSCVGENATQIAEICSAAKSLSANPSAVESTLQTLQQKPELAAPVKQTVVDKTSNSEGLGLADQNSTSGNFTQTQINGTVLLVSGAVVATGGVAGLLSYASNSNSLKKLQSEKMDRIIEIADKVYASDHNYGNVLFVSPENLEVMKGTDSKTYLNRIIDWSETGYSKEKFQKMVFDFGSNRVTDPERLASFILAAIALDHPIDEVERRSFETAVKNRNLDKTIQTKILNTLHSEQKTLKAYNYLSIDTGGWGVPPENQKYAMHTIYGLPEEVKIPKGLASGSKELKFIDAKRSVDMYYNYNAFGNKSMKEPASKASVATALLSTVAGVGGGLAAAEGAHELGYMLADTSNCTNSETLSCYLNTLGDVYTQVMH